MTARQDDSTLPQTVIALLDRQQSLEASLTECTALLRQTLTEHAAGDAALGVPASVPGWLSPMMKTIEFGAGEGDVVEALADAVQYLLPESAGAVSLVNESASTALVAAWRDGRRWSSLAGSATRGEDESLLHELSRTSVERSVRVILSGLGMTVGELRVWPSGDALEAQAEQLKAIAGIAGLALAGYTLKQRLRHRSVHDALTGLFNFRYLQDTLERELHRVRRNQSALGLIMVEIPDLPLFAAEHGQDASDRLLEAVAGILQASFRGSDVCSRYSEHRLCVVMPDANLDGTARRAESLRQELRELTLARRGERLRLPGVAIGVAAYPTHADTGESLLAAAESAVYQAGAAGGERVVRAERVV